MKNYLKGFKKFCSDKVNLVLILTVIFLIIGFSFFYTFVVFRAQSVFINQAYNREELAVSSGASSIKVFLDMVENSLLLLSRESSVINQEAETQAVLDRFVFDWAGTPVLGVVRFDKDGQALFMANNIGEPNEVIKNLVVVDRSYFTWAETAAEGDTYLGKPVIPRAELTEKQYYFPLVTPLYRNGEFDGTLVLGISLPKLTETYLDPVKVSPNCRAYLFHPDGTILAGIDELVGFNYFEFLRDNPYPGSEEALQGLKKVVEDKNGGRLSIILFSPTEDKLIRFIVTYASIIYGDEHWIYGLAVPISDILTSFNPLRENSIVMFSIFIFVILFLSAIGILFARIGQRNAYLDGLKDGKKNKK